MIIAITANSAWNLYNFRKSLIKKLLEQKHEVITIAPLDDSVELLIQETGAKFIPINSLSRKGNNPFQDFKLIQEYKKIYKQHNIDIAIQYTIKPNIYGSIAGSISNTKTISNLTGLGFVFLKKSVANRIAKSLYKFALKRTNFACFHNATDARLFEELKLVSSSKIKVINGSGVDTEHFQGTPRVKNEKFTFLFIGRLLYDKGIVELLDAYKNIYNKNKNIALHILGDIDDGNPASLSIVDFENYRKETKIVHHGMQMNVKEFINQSDCVVLPSYREGLPKSLLEAMSMSKPIITVDSVGCDHLIEDEKNGFKAKVKSSDSLQEYMEKMIALNETELRSMGQAGRSIVLAKYSSEIINNEYIKLISQLNG